MKNAFEKQRDALEAIRDLIADLREENPNVTFRVKETIGMIEMWAKDGLAAQRRNCDVGSLENQQHRFGQFCMNTEKPRCNECISGDLGQAPCVLKWEQMPYMKEG